MERWEFGRRLRQPPADGVYEHLEVRVEDLAGFTVDDLGDGVILELGRQRSTDAPEVPVDDFVLLRQHGVLAIDRTWHFVYQPESEGRAQAERFAALLEHVVETMLADGVELRSYNPSFFVNAAEASYGIRMKEKSLPVAYARALDLDAQIQVHIRDLDQSHEADEITRDASRRRNVILKPDQYLSLPTEELERNLETLSAALANGSPIITGRFGAGLVTVQLIKVAPLSYEIRGVNLEQRISTVRPVPAEGVRVWLIAASLPPEALTWTIGDDLFPWRSS